MSTPLEDFFAQFADLGFAYHQNKTAHNNFKRLRKVSGWDIKSDEWTSARVGFNNALGEQFNFIFGMGDLESWQKLCSFIDITPVPDRIGDCQKVLQNVHVNIVDLLECARTGEPVQKFATLEELKKYTIKRKRIFPRRFAYPGGLLKNLLRQIYGTGTGERRPGGKKRRRKKARKQAAAVQSS